MIIGINGLKGSGKDTIGQHLVDSWGFEKASFAKKLKESAAALFDIDPVKWEDWKNNPNMRVMIYTADPLEYSEVVSDGDSNYFYKSITVREFLQRYGTEAHRDIFGADFWVYSALSEISPFSPDYVFTDARFENELSAIIEDGGYIIEVVRPGLESNDTHASEVRPPSDLIDYTIINDGTFEELYSKVDEVMEHIAKREDSAFVKVANE